MNNPPREYIALDVETTGLSPQNARIIELAAIKFKDGEPVDEFVTMLNPLKPIPSRITQITGISSSMVSGAPTETEIFPHFINFIEELPLVAHNADFDMGFLNAAAARNNAEINNPVHCTLKLARKLLNLPNNKLETVAALFGLNEYDFHRAKSDAIVAGRIFYRMNMMDIPEQNQLAPKTVAPKNELTVSELNQYIKNLIETDQHLLNVAVVGEISNFKHHFSGHLYFNLKDENSNIRAVAFQFNAKNFKFEPEDGMKVLATGRISVYEKSGNYQLYVDSMTPYGIGDLHIAYEQLKKKLEEEGLFSPEHKKPIPKFPNSIGVVTSPTGAVIRDIINVASRRFPSTEIILHPAKVQGDGGAAQIAEAINYFNENFPVDVLIVGRGGGSIEDLWEFNTEKVARAIAASKIPIISAVGHETDFTIADFVADLRAPTPSAAAEIAVPDSAKIKETCINFYRRMLTALRNDIAHKRQTLARFSLKSPADLLLQKRLFLDAQIDKIQYGITRVIESRKAALGTIAAKLNALSPLNVLSRGYSVTLLNGKPIRSTVGLKVNDKIQTTLQKGSIISKIMEVQNG